MVIDAPCGRLEGFTRGGVHHFRGIPYAAPPVGARRFLPPRPLPRWAGLRPCKQYGSAAPQKGSPGGASAGMDEDCLYLNVTTPGTTGRAPVLLWVHGGALRYGAGPLGFRPELFARAGSVAVSVNYRLGALGFLDVSPWLGESYRQSGNSGLLDVLQALRWVRENIASFGGDPDQVTIMGQSAGAKLCGALTLMEGAQGLFRRAVLASGAVQTIRDRHTACQVGAAFLRAAGLEDPAALLTLPWGAVVDVQRRAFPERGLAWLGPVQDGITLPETDPLALARRGGVDLLLGTNRDEMELFWQAWRLNGLDRSLAEDLFGNRAPLVLAAYEGMPPAARSHEGAVHFLTEQAFRAGTVDLAEAAAEAGRRVYLYRLDWDRQRLRACHGSETQFSWASAWSFPT